VSSDSDAIEAGKKVHANVTEELAAFIFRVEK
jgi:hypothetical protein